MLSRSCSLRRCSDIVHRHATSAAAASTSPAIEEIDRSSSSGQLTTQNPDQRAHHHDQHHDRRAPTQHETIDRVLRESHAAQSAAAAFWRGQNCISRHGVDIRAFRQEQAVHLQEVEQLLPKHRARPSLLTGTLSAASCALGMFAAVAPRSLSLAVSGAVQDALQEHYNDQLRDMGEAGVLEAAPDVRRALVALRDSDHAPEGAPPPPGIVDLQRMEKLGDIGLGGAVGAMIKTAARMALATTQKL